MFKTHIYPESILLLNAFCFSKIVTKSILSKHTLKYVANKDMKAFAKDLKTIYTAADEEAAGKQLKTVTEKWSGQYPSAMNRWHDNWDAISPIFKFSKEVRTAFYTTNAVESLNYAIAD